MDAVKAQQLLTAAGKLKAGYPIAGELFSKPEGIA